MIDLISRRALIRALDNEAMAHHESQVPMVESDFRRLIKEAQRYDYRKPDAVCLSFAKYCMNCEDCEAEVRTAPDNSQIIQCIHRRECAHLVEVLEKRLAEDE